MLCKDPPNSGNHVPLTIQDRLNHYRWWPAFDHRVWIKQDGHVPNCPGTWLVVEDQVPTLPFIPANVLEVRINKEVSRIPLVTWVTVVGRTYRRWIDAGTVQRLHY